MEFTYQPAPDDYAAVMRSMSLRHRTYWFAIASFGAVFVLGLFMLDQMPLGWLFLLPLPLCILYIAVYLPMMWSRQARRTPKMMAEMSWQVDDQQVVIRNAQQETRMDWAKWERCVELERYFLFFLAENKRMFQFVPKRAFQSPEQLAAFRELVSRKLPVK